MRCPGDHSGLTFCGGDWSNTVISTGIGTRTCLSIGLKLFERIDNVKWQSENSMRLRMDNLTVNVALKEN